MNPGFLILAAAGLVLGQVGITWFVAWWCCRDVRGLKDQISLQNQELEAQMEARLDEMDRKLGAFLRATQDAITLATEALEVQRQWAEIARQDRPIKRESGD